MKPNERISSILNLITESDSPISGNTLAEKFNVSRQIIVKDISTLKSSGVDIISTTRGYILNRKPMPERIFKVVHSDEDTEKELTEIVKTGGIIENVFVWHKIYGKIEAPLNIRTLDDVKEYIKTLKSGRSSPLKNVTNQYHYHLIKGETEQILDDTQKTLERLGYLVYED